jgi:hypothetical protein
MKVYVHGYKPKKRKQEEERLPYREHEVFYSKEPTWKMEQRYQAESECIVLHNMRVHLGEHVCKFTVEEVSDGQFAVVCLSHPDR